MLIQMKLCSGLKKKQSKYKYTETTANIVGVQVDKPQDGWSLIIQVIKIARPQM